MTIQFQHPAAGQEKEQFNLIVADGSLPDIMEWQWVKNYPGGPEKAIKDGVIIPLNDIFKEYCPNITKYLAENPDIDKTMKRMTATISPSRLSAARTSYVILWAALSVRTGWKSWVWRSP